MLLADDGSIISSQETTPINDPLPVPPAIIPDSAVLGSQDQPQSPPPGVPGFTEFDSGDNGAGSPLSSDINIGDGGAQPMGPLAAPAGFPSAPGNFMAPSPIVPNFNDIRNSVGDLFSGLGGAVHGAADAIGNQIQQSYSSDNNAPGDSAINDLFGGNFGALPQDLGTALNQFRDGATPNVAQDGVNPTANTIGNALSSVSNYPLQGAADLLTNNDDKNRIGSDLQQAWNDRGNNPFGNDGSLKPSADALNTIGNAVFNVKTLHENLAASFAPQMGHDAGNNLADALAGPINFAASFMGPQGKVAIATFVANLMSDPKQAIEGMGQQLEGFPALVNAFHRWKDGGHAPTGQEIGNGVQAIMLGGMLGHQAYGGIKGVGDRVNYESVKQAGPINQAIARNSTLPSVEDVQASLNNPRLPEEAGPNGMASQSNGPVSPNDIAKSFLNKEITSDQVDQILQQNGISDQEFTQALTQEHGAIPQDTPSNKPQSFRIGTKIVEPHEAEGFMNDMVKQGGITQEQADKILSDHNIVTNSSLSKIVEDALGHSPEGVYDMMDTHDPLQISEYMRIGSQDGKGYTEEQIQNVRKALEQYNEKNNIDSGRSLQQRTADQMEEENKNTILKDHLPDGEYGVNTSAEFPSNKVGTGADAVSHDLVSNIQPTPKLEEIGQKIQTLVLGEGDYSEANSAVDFIKGLYRNLDTADPTWVSQYFNLPKSTVSQVETLLRQFNQEAGLQPGGNMDDTKTMIFPSGVVPTEGPAPLLKSFKPFNPMAPEGSSLNTNAWAPKRGISVGPVDHTDVEGVKKNLEASGQVEFRPPHKVDNGWILPDGSGVQMKDFDHIAVVNYAKMNNENHLTYNDLLKSGYIRMAKESGGPFTPEILHFDTGDLTGRVVNRIEEYLTTNVIEDNVIPMAVTVSKLPEEGKDVHWSTYSFPFSMKDFVENGFNLRKTIDQAKRGAGHRLFTDIGGNYGVKNNGQGDSPDQANSISQTNQGRNQDIGQSAEARNWWKGPNVTDQRPQYAKAIPIRETNAQSTGTIDLKKKVEDLINSIPEEYREKLRNKPAFVKGVMNDPLNAFGDGSAKLNQAYKEAAQDTKLTNPYGLVKWINKDPSLESEALYRFGQDGVDVNPLAAIPARWHSAMAGILNYQLDAVKDELSPHAVAEASRKFDEIVALDDKGLAVLHLAHEGFHLAHYTFLSPGATDAREAFSRTILNLPKEYLENLYQRGMNFKNTNRFMHNPYDFKPMEAHEIAGPIYEAIVNDLLHYHNVPGAGFAHQAGMEVYANELTKPEVKAAGVQILGQFFDDISAHYNKLGAASKENIEREQQIATGVGGSSSELPTVHTDTHGPAGRGGTTSSDQARLAFVQAHTSEVLNLAKRGVESWDQFVKDLNAPKTELARQTADRVLNDLPQKDVVFWKDISKKIAPVAITEARAAREFQNPASKPRTQPQTDALAPRAPEVTDQLGSVGESGAPMVDKAGPSDISRGSHIPVDIGRRYPIVPQEVARSLVTNLHLQKFDDPSNLNRFFDKVRGNDAKAQATLKKLSPNLRKWVKDNIGLSSQGKAVGEIPVPHKAISEPAEAKPTQPSPGYFPEGIPGRSDDSRFTPTDTPKTPFAEGKDAAGLGNMTRSDDSRFGQPEKAKTPQEFINGIDASTLTPDQKELLSGIQKQMGKLTEQKAILEAAQRAHQPIPLEDKVNKVANTSGHKAQAAAKKVQITKNALDSAIRMGVPPAVLKDVQAKHDIAVSRFNDVLDGTTKVYQTSDPVVDRELKKLNETTAKVVEESLTKVNPESTPQSSAEDLSKKAGFVNWQQVVDIKKGHVQKNYFIETSAGNGRRVGQIVKTPFTIEEGKEYSPVSITGRDGFEWTRDKKTGDITIKDPKHLFLGDHKDVWKALDKDFKSAVNPLFRAGEKPMTPSPGEAAVQHEYSKDKPFEPEIKSDTALTGKEKAGDPKVVRATRAKEKLVAQGIVHPLDTTMADIARLTRSDDPRFAAEQDIAEEETLSPSESRTKQAAIAEKATAYQGVRDLSEEAENDPLGLNKTSPAHSTPESAGGGGRDAPPPRGPSGDPGDDEYGGPFGHPQNYKKNPYLLKPEEHQALEKLARGGKDHAKLVAIYRSMMNGFASLNDPALFEMDGRLRAAAIKSQKDRLEFLADRKTELMQKLFTKEQRIAVNDARDEIDESMREDNINALQTQGERNFARAEEAYYNYKGRVGEAKKMFTRGVEDYYVPRIFKNVSKDENKIEKSAGAIPGFNKSNIRRKMVDTGAVDELGNPILRPKYINIKSLEEATGREAHHDAAVTGLLHDKGFIRSFSTHHMIENFKDTSAFIGKDFAGPLVMSSSDLQDFRNEDMAGKYRAVTKGEFAPGLRGYHVANELADFLERYTDIDNFLSHFQGSWKKYKFAMSPYHYMTTMSRVASYIASEDPRWKGVASSATGMNLVRALGVWRRGTKLLANDPTRVADKMVGLGGLKKSSLANLPDELQATLNWNNDTKNPLGKLNNMMQDALWNRFVYPIQIGLADWMDETRRKTGSSNPAEGSPEELMHWRSLIQQSESAVMLVPKEELSNTLKKFASALVSRDLTMTQVRGAGRSILPTSVGKKLFNQSLYNLWETAPWHDIDPKVRNWNVKRTTKLARGSFIHMAIGLIAASFLANAASSAIMNMGGSNEPINTPLDNFLDSPIDAFNIYIGRDHLGRRQYLTMPLYAWFTEMVNYPLAAITAHNNNNANLKDSLGATTSRMTNKLMPYVTTPFEIVANQQLWKIMNGYDAKSATLDSDSGVARVSKFLQDNHIPDGGGIVQKIAYALERMDPLPLPGTQAINNGVQGRWPTDVLGGGQAGAMGAQAISALGERVAYGPARFNGLTSQQIYQSEQSHFTDQQNLVSLLTAPSSGNPAEDQARWQMAKGIMMAHPEMSASHIANLIKQQQTKAITDAQNAQLKTMNPAEAAYVKAAQKGYLPGTGVPADPTLYGQSLNVDQYSELQTRMLKSRLDTVNMLASNPSFQGLTESEKTQQIGDVVGLADTMTRQAYAQELGMQVGNKVNANEVSNTIQKAITFRNAALDTVRGSEAFNTSSPSEQQAILQRYGTYAQTMLTRQSFGDLKGVSDDNMQRMILNSVNNEENIRDYVMNTQFYQNASPGDRQKMLSDYSKLTQSVTEKTVQRIGQGEFKDQMMNDFSVVPQLKSVINTEETTKGLLHSQPFYQMSSEKEQKSLDTKYSNLAKAIADQDLRKGTSTSGFNGISSGFNSGNERVISGHLMADAALSDLEAQYGGPEQIKQYASLLADQEKTIAQDSNVSPKTISYLKNINRQAYLARNPEYAQYLKAKTNWQRGTNVGRLYAALNADETTLAANMVSNIGSGQPQPVYGNDGLMYDAFGNILDTSSVNSSADISGLVSDPTQTDLSGNAQDSTVL